MSLTTRIFHFLARMPLPLMQRLGAVLGWMVWWLSPSYRRNFQANVKAAGVAWRDARPAVAAIGSMVADMALSMGMKVVGFDPALSIDAAWRLSSEVSRMENLQALLARAAASSAKVVMGFMRDSSMLGCHHTTRALMNEPTSFPAPAHVAAVVLAAGAATRMGGRPKCLLEMAGEALIGRLVRALAQVRALVLAQVGAGPAQPHRAIRARPVPGTSCACTWRSARCGPRCRWQHRARRSGCRRLGKR